MSEPTAVYRLYDAAGVLLYVGISLDLSTRLKTHQKEKTGWPAVTRIDLQWCATREAAIAEERRAILSEQPLWNVIGSGRPSYVQTSKWRTIVGAIRAEIESGYWPPGTRIDSAAEWARQDRSVAASTVRKALRHLIESGELRGRLGAAVYVADRVRPIN